MKTRKELELDIVYNMENKATLEQVLAECWASGHFTKDEMEIIVAGSKVYDKLDAPMSTDIIDNRVKLSQKIGPTKAFVLLHIMKQFPEATIDKEGYFKIDRKSILKSVHINESQLVNLLNDLSDEHLLHKKKIKNGLVWCIDFPNINKIIE